MCSDGGLPVRSAPFGIYSLSFTTHRLLLHNASYKGGVLQ